MSENDGCLVTCVVSLDWVNQHGQSTRKVKYRSASLRLKRNNLKDMYVEVLPNAKNSPTHKLLVKNVKVLNRFMGEGKASIIFQLERCTLLMSNAPVSNLITFLKTIFVKVTGKDSSVKENRKLTALDILSADNNLTDISPITTTELKTSKEKTKLKTINVTTPSPKTIRKRKLNDIGGSPSSPKIPRGKRLNLESSEIKLTEEQQRIIDSIQAGHNIFFTGSAGTGKSFLLRKIISILPPDVTAVTASTGVAACHIGGTTLHRFAGIGLANGSIDDCKKKVSNSSAAANWRKIKHLIIDEISMVDGDFFTKLEAVARFVKKSDKPFGGIQLIICGDFFQLPPISKSNEKANFCFQSEAWSKCVQLNYELKRVHRQKDHQFVQILNEIRMGCVNQETLQVLQKTSLQRIETEDIKATRLCSHVNEANEINKTQLAMLPGETVVFRAEDSDPKMVETLDRDLPVSSVINLKIGAQVMLVKNINISSGLTNGARGVVAKFKDGLPIVHFKSGEYYKVNIEKWSVQNANGAIIYRKQIPLKLAWAFSIHKSQGLTLDCVEMNLARVFDAGQAYVALSRAQSLKSLRVLNFNSQQVWANKGVIRFYKILQRNLHDMEYIPLGRSNSMK